MDDRRIGEDDPGVGVLADRKVDRCEPKVDTDLGRREAEPGRFPPGLEEIFDKCAKLFVKQLDRPIGRLETRVAVYENRANCQSSVDAVPGPMA